MPLRPSKQFIMPARLKQEVAAALRLWTRLQSGVGEHGAKAISDETGREIEEDRMKDRYHQEDVADWFERSSMARIMERRTRGITADFVLGELVRRPGDPARTSATTLTTRTQGPDQTPPGQGEWLSG